MLFFMSIVKCIWKWLQNELHSICYPSLIFTVVFPDQCCKLTFAKSWRKHLQNRRIQVSSRPISSKPTEITFVLTTKSSPIPWFSCGVSNTVPGTKDVHTFDGSVLLHNPCCNLLHCITLHYGYNYREMTAMRLWIH